MRTESTRAHGKEDGGDFAHGLVLIRRSVRHGGDVGDVAWSVARRFTKEIVESRIQDARLPGPVN
jgi:hypothetical protein